jgi:hypothetical protein
MRLCVFYDYVCSTLTSKQIQGGITFRQACEEFRVPREANRAYDIMDRPVKGQKVKDLKALTNGTSDVDAVVAQVSEQMSDQIKGLVSTMVKRQNTGTSDYSATGSKNGAIPSRLWTKSSSRNMYATMVMVRMVSMPLPIECRFWPLDARKIANGGCAEPDIWILVRRSICC